MLLDVIAALHETTYSFCYVPTSDSYEMASITLYHWVFGVIQQCYECVESLLCFQKTNCTASNSSLLVD